MDRDRVLEFFTADRPRLVRLAARILADPAEAEDIVQQAWLRLDRADVSAIDSPGAWLTTVVTRLCLDRLKARVPVPVADYTGAVRPAVSPVDPVDDVVLVDSVGAALHVVVDRLSPTERVAFVLHDSFGVEFAAISEILDCTPAAARKLASRARARVGGGLSPGHDATDGVEGAADAAVVDAFLAAARNGEFARLVSLLAPDVVVVGDPVAVGIGTPERIEGRDAVAEFFNGAAAAALPVFVDDRPGAAWFDRGAARVAFDFLVEDGVVSRIDFRAEERVLHGVRRRRRTCPVTSDAPGSSEE